MLRQIHGEEPIMFASSCYDFLLVGSICCRPSHEREAPVLTIVGSDVDTCLLNSNSLPRRVFCKNGKHHFFANVLREAPPSSDLQKDAHV